VVRAIEDARAACEDHRWGDAWRLLSGVPIDALDVDDLDRLGTAAYLTGHDEEGFAHWVRAHQLCGTTGEVHRAANFGVKLAQGLGFKGDLGRCRGWVDRTARLLEEAGIDCVEQGYLQHAWGCCGSSKPATWPGPTPTSSKPARSALGSPITSS
jgi:hypothetical protein